MKKFNKIFAIAFAVLFLASSAAFACEGANCYNAQGYRNFANSFDNGGAGSHKEVNSTSLWGWGDDHAYAGAGGGANAGYQAYSGGKGLFIGNFATGSENTGSDSTAGALALDFGNTSVAGAYAGQESFGNADAFSLGGGLGKGTAWTTTGASVGGSVNQSNIAREFQIPGDYNHGTYAEAGNSSGAMYEGYANDQHCYNGSLVWGSASSTDLKGSAFTAGGSFATKDDTGNYRSSYGKTWNESQANLTGEDYGQTGVYGNGTVQTRAGVGVQGQGGSATGLSQFGYEGATYGKGGAEHETYATKFSTFDTNSSRSGSSGSAFSFAVGAPPKMVD